MFFLKYFKARFNSYLNKVEEIKTSRIVVFQMGKVASTSLQKAIPFSSHIHNLYTGKMVISPGAKTSSLISKALASFGRMLLRHHVKKESAKILCPVREPGSRAQSMFFQNLPAHMQAYFNSEKGRQEVRGEGDSSKTLENAFWFSRQLKYPEIWLKEELCRLLSVPYAEISVTPGKASLIQGKYNQCLIFRIEDVNSLLPEIEAFLGVKLKIKNDNSASDKWYYELYKSFKSNSLLQDKIKSEACSLDVAEKLGYSPKDL